MAQNIKINGVTYNSVSSLSIPLDAGGDNAVFPDTSDATAEAGDIAEGKTAYIDGSKVTGTATGGGGEWNIFTQTTEPTETDGLWIKSDAVQHVDFTELVAADGAALVKGGTLTAALNVTASVTIGGIAYIFGGRTGHTTSVNTIQAYDPATDIRTTKSATLNMALWGLTAVGIGGLAYLFGGHVSNTETRSGLQVYDPATDTTTAGGSVTDSGESSGVNIGGIAYLFGGCRQIGLEYPNIFRKSIVAYDPMTNTRTTKLATLASERALASVVAINGLAYVFGGEYSASGGVYNTFDTIQAYDPMSDIMTTKAATLSTGINATSAAEIGGIAYVLGGKTTYSDVNSYVKTIQAYDPITDVRTTKAELLPHATSKSSAVHIGGAIYLFGFVTGRYNQGSNIIQAYKVSTNQFDAGTAIVNLDAGVENAPILYQDNKITLRPRIKDVLLQGLDGLHHVDAAVNISGGGWINL